MQTLLECSRKYFTALNTPRSLTCAILVRYGEWDQLAQLRVDPNHYLDAEAYYLDALATDFLRKFPNMPTKRDRKTVAYSKYIAAEQQCAATNARLTPLLNHFYSDVRDLPIGDFLQRVRCHVSAVIGRVPSEALNPRFGPGATIEDRGRLTTVCDKMVSTPALTTGALPFLELWKHTAWGRGYLLRYEKRGRLKIVDFGRYTTAPKDALTDRSIEIQPSINMFYQLPIGGVIRRRLKKVGIDLDNGQDVHRRVACEASVTGQFSTIDLSSASDTISTEVVKALLPPMWYDVLSSLRTSKSLTPSGIKLFLSKFSAMGNGFTFELETLIFSSLVHCTLESIGIQAKAGVNYWVYGDDIIVPNEATRAVLAVLAYFGFTPNRHKTFSTGPFRESCGGDFFDGKPVRAHFQKESLDKHQPHTYISLANGLRRCWLRLPTGQRRAALVATWHWVLDQIPAEIRLLRGPDSLGDIVIHDDRRWFVRPDREDPVNRMEIRCWVPIPVVWSLNHWPNWVRFAGALYGVDSEGLSSRDDISGYRRGWVSLIERPN